MVSAAETNAMEIQANGEHAAPVAPVASDTAVTDQDVHGNGQQTFPVDPEVDQTRHLIPYELAQQVDLTEDYLAIIEGGTKLVGSTGLSDEAARKFATCMVASFALLARQKRQKELQQMADQP